MMLREKHRLCENIFDYIWNKEKTHSVVLNFYDGRPRKQIVLMFVEYLCFKFSFKFYFTSTFPKGYVIILVRIVKNNPENNTL
jgi:hypothetical protein